MGCVYYLDKFHRFMDWFDSLPIFDMIVIPTLFVCALGFIWMWGYSVGRNHSCAVSTAILRDHVKFAKQIVDILNLDSKPQIKIRAIKQFLKEGK